MDKGTKTYRYLKALSQVVVILAIGIGSIWIASLVTKEDTQSGSEIAKEIIKEVIIKRPSCADTSASFEELKNSGQIVTLAKNLNSYGKDGDFINMKYTVVKSSGSGSQIACGYLYVKAHVGDRPLQLQWEHPYIKPGQFGGHIVTDKAIANKEVDSKTELLFNLSKINYRFSNASSEIDQADWAALFNVTNKIGFDMALNTTINTGIIDEISIAYQCWSPETGQITKDCKLTVE